MAHLDGSNDAPGAEVVPLALARLEKMIESRIGDAIEAGDEREPLVKVRVIERQREEDERPNPLDLPMEPEFYEGLVDRIMETIGDAIGREESVLNDLPDGVLAFPGQVEESLPQELATRCDYFVARLRCQHCRAVSENDASTHCETFLRPNPDGSELRVGDWVGEVQDTQRPDYYARAVEHVDKDVHILEGWECPCCHEVNWAEITIRDGFIASIWSVELTRETLDRVHLVSSECVEVAAKLTGREPWTLLGDDILDLIYENL